MGKSNSNCCVVGCRHTYANSPGLSFYTFPGKQWEFKRKLSWIRAIRRKNPDGSPWIPSKHDRVCSIHFVGGKMSNIEHHPAYVPSIFPDIYDNKRILDVTETNSPNLSKKHKISCPSFVRKRREKEIWKTKLPGSSQEIIMTVDEDDDEEGNTWESPKGHVSMDAPKTQRPVSLSSKSTQVAFELTRSSFEFSSALLDGSLQTQCNLDNNEFSIKKDAACSTDVHCCEEFLTLPYEALLEMTGIPAGAFAELQSFLRSRISNSIAIATDKALLVFLLKMRMGLSFSNLSTFFNLPTHSTRNIFLKVLDVLSSKTRGEVTWPSKEEIFRNSPRGLGDLFPGSRAVVDCLQLAAEMPTLLEDRRNMYSTSKSTCTFKFLLAVSPNRKIIFKSNCYGGKCEDRFIYDDSGFLQLLEDGDLILTKTNPGISPKCGQIKVLPSLIKVEEDEERHGTLLCSMRAYLDQTVRNLRMFHILSYIPRDLFSYVDNVVHMACVLTNMCSAADHS